MWADTSRGATMRAYRDSGALPRPLGRCTPALSSRYRLRLSASFMVRMRSLEKMRAAMKAKPTNHTI